MSKIPLGKQAEEKAAKFLKKQGYQVLGRNWRNQFCEIDIIAKKADTIYFIEVKYRSSDSAGSGLDYITPQKLKQMEFAASNWMHSANKDFDYEMGVITLSGKNMEIDNVLIGL